LRKTFSAAGEAAAGKLPSLVDGLALPPGKCHRLLRGPEDLQGVASAQTAGARRPGSCSWESGCGGGPVLLKMHSFWKMMKERKVPQIPRGDAYYFNTF
jgi:hypothetical protein